MLNYIDGNEHVLDDFSCAYVGKILLQGTMYVTNKSINFYSHFNDRTLVGSSTKINIPFTTIVRIQKETNFLAIPNVIRFILTNQK